MKIRSGSPADSTSMGSPTGTRSTSVIPSGCARLKMRTWTTAKRVPPSGTLPGLLREKATSWSTRSVACWRRAGNPSNA